MDRLEKNDLSALGYPRETEVHSGDEHKMSLIERLLTTKMSSNEKDKKEIVAVERDIISEAMGHL